MKNNEINQEFERFGHHRDSNETFAVPEGYFVSQREQVLVAIKDSRVSENPLKKYAMAASIALVIGASTGLFYLQSWNSDAETLTSDDFATYLLHENTDTDQLAYHVEDDQLQYDLPQVSDESIKDYLNEQDIDIHHLTIDQ